jgi:predicted permease
VALGETSAVGKVAVVQMGMPPALVSVILATRNGCDAAFAAGAAVLATLLCGATLPLVLELLHRAPF